MTRDKSKPKTKEKVKRQVKLGRPVVMKNVMNSAEAFHGFTALVSFLKKDPTKFGQKNGAVVRVPLNDEEYLYYTVYQTVNNYVIVKTERMPDDLFPKEEIDNVDVSQ